MSNSFTFALFGSTGLTGSQFVKVAIDNGHKVKVLVRNPDKLDPAIRDKVEIFQGTLKDHDIIKRMIPGCNYAVVMAGNIEESKKSHFMNEFIINLIPSLKQHRVRLLYQAGAFCARYNEQLAWDVYIIRNTIGFSYRYLLADNDAVIKTLGESEDVEWIVTRPAVITNGPSKGTLRPIVGVSHMSSAIDLATYSLSLIQNENAVRTNDYVGYY